MISNSLKNTLYSKEFGHPLSTIPYDILTCEELLNSLSFEASLRNVAAVGNITGCFCCNCWNIFFCKKTWVIRLNRSTRCIEYRKLMVLTKEISVRAHRGITNHLWIRKWTCLFIIKKKTNTLPHNKQTNYFVIEIISSKLFHTLYYLSYAFVLSYM